MPESSGFNLETLASFAGVFGFVISLWTAISLWLSRSPSFIFAPNAGFGGDKMLILRIHNPSASPLQIKRITQCGSKSEPSVVYITDADRTETGTRRIVQQIMNRGYYPIYIAPQSFKDVEVNFNEDASVSECWLKVSWGRYGIFPRPPYFIRVSRAVAKELRHGLGISAD